MRNVFSISRLALFIHLHPHHSATSLHFRTEVLLAEDLWYSYWSGTKTGESSVTSYPSLSVIIPGPHLSLALAKTALDDVPALNFKTAESQTRVMSSRTYTRRGHSAAYLHGKISNRYALWYNMIMQPVCTCADLSLIDNSLESCPDLPPGFCEVCEFYQAARRASLSPTTNLGMKNTL